jgi:transposase-like protein
MIRICPSHRRGILDCGSCFEMMSSSALLVGEETALKKALESATSTKEALERQKQELIDSLITIKEKLYLKNPILPKRYIRDSQLVEYILNLSMPLNILTIIYDAELALAFLFQKKMLRSSLKCKCSKDCVLKRQNKHFYFVCDCGGIFHVTHNSFWEKYELPPGKIVLMVFLWVMNTNNPNISQVLCLDTGIVNEIIDKIRGIVSQHYVDTLPKFKGVVEIDESCFKTGRDRFNRFLKDRWVFGLYERERKLVYMQVVAKRNARTLIPIIKDRCEIGTTIISDQWNAYNKLEEVGFPHYTVDHSRFFVNPHSREIHTQDIEISWCWAKYNIKKHRNYGSLQNLLNIFCWMRQFKKPKKESELADILNAVASVLANYQEKKILDNLIIQI